MQTKQRASNFELLRLLLMLAIVAEHVINNGVLALDGTGFYRNSVLAGTVDSFLIMAVDCFILISGYFGMRLKMEKAVRLVLTMVFYGVVIYLAFVALGLAPFRVTALVGYALPLHWWFVVYYLILMLFSPFLNLLIEKMSRAGYRRLLLMMVVLFPITTTLVGYQFGGGLTSFVILYFIGRYVRLYWQDKGFQWRWLLGFLVSCGITAAGSYLLHTQLHTPYNWEILPFSGDGITVMAAAFCLFLFFRGIRLQSSVINRLAACALGIYIVHEHPLVRAFYLQRFGVANYYNSSSGLFLQNLALTALCVYAASLLIEFVRLTLLGKTEERLSVWLWNCKPVIALRGWMNRLLAKQNG